MIFVSISVWKQVENLPILDRNRIKVFLRELWECVNLFVFQNENKNERVICEFNMD